MTNKTQEVWVNEEFEYNLNNSQSIKNTKEDNQIQKNQIK